MRSFLLAYCLGLSAVSCPLSAQVAPKPPADAPLTTDEAKKLQAVMTKATASPEAKAAEENLRKAREELHRMGIPTACRPMPEGAPIGGSTEGSKSVVQ